MKKDSIFDVLGFGVCLIITLIILAIYIGITYLIGTSNLPDWVKFLLLK